jgi:ABC-2 type transport system ATP-binding protein
MQAVDVSHIIKNFSTIRAVDDVSFNVEKGEIFGLLGPNGAGKTTILRIILDIFKPDKGTINVLGGQMNEAIKDRIGYLPEERGLYQDIQLDRCLVYLATLKGLSTQDARKRVAAYLDQFDLASSRSKKIKELSKGMQQKAQLIATLVHQPDLLIIDEPFAALDPVNTQMIKDLLREQRKDGVSIIMCTHQMHQVEELCDRLVLIDHGKVMLYGSLGDIRQQYASHDILVRTNGMLPTSIPGVDSAETTNSSIRLVLSPGTSPQKVLRYLLDHDIPVEQFELAVPDLDEIFIRIVQGSERQS